MPSPINIQARRIWISRPGVRLIRRPIKATMKPPGKATAPVRPLRYGSMEEAGGPKDGIPEIQNAQETDQQEERVSPGPRHRRRNRQVRLTRPRTRAYTARLQKRSCRSAELPPCRRALRRSSQCLFARASTPSRPARDGDPTRTGRYLASLRLRNCGQYAPPSLGRARPRPRAQTAFSRASPPISWRPVSPARLTPGNRVFTHAGSMLRTASATSGRVAPAAPVGEWRRSCFQEDGNVARVVCCARFAGWLSCRSPAACPCTPG